MNYMLDTFRKGLCDHSSSKLIFTLTSYNFLCISTPLLALEMTTTITNWMRQFPSQSNGLEMDVEWKVLAIGATSYLSDSKSKRFS